MKKRTILIFFYLVLFQVVTFAIEPFRFALFSDLHISTSNPVPAEDLSQSVTDVNALQGIDFVIVSGDVSESGDA